MVTISSLLSRLGSDRFIPWGLPGLRSEISPSARSFSGQQALYKTRPLQRRSVPYWSEEAEPGFYEDPLPVLITTSVQDVNANKNVPRGELEGPPPRPKLSHDGQSQEILSYRLLGL